MSACDEASTTDGDMGTAGVDERDMGVEETEEEEEEEDEEEEEEEMQGLDFEVGRELGLEGLEEEEDEDEEEGSEGLDVAIELDRMDFVLVGFLGDGGTCV